MSRVRLSGILICLSLILCLAAALSGIRIPVSVRFDSRSVALNLPEIQFPRGTVDVNNGDIHALMELPGVGETLAQAIIDERELRGCYYYPEDLIQAKGIGVKKLAGMYEWIDLSNEED